MQYVLSVTEINKYIKQIISGDLILSNLMVKGEISNYKSHYSGHMYFTLKDEKSLIKCVMFKGHAVGLKFVPENGMKVIVKGYISVFERDGQYQLYAEEMQPDGIGSLHVAFEQLKKKLQDEGIFDQAVKKKLPFLPETIGVVTSSTGSVIRDIINVLGRRFPNVEVKLYPVQVQGENAAKQIAKAVKRFNELNNVDVIIVARGGGSLEELWAFNEEIVARSIYESRIPVVSAVGHETDFTISDFAADLRAPTPSAAAEIVVPEKRVLKDKIYSLDSRLKYSLQKKISINKIEFEKLSDSVVFRHPFNFIYQERMKLDILNKYLTRAFNSNKDKLVSKFALLISKLEALSPLEIMARGYSITKLKSDNNVIVSTKQVKINDKVEVMVIDGSIICKVSDIKEDKLYEER